MTRPTPEILAEIRRAMTAQGVTHRELARRAGVAHPHITRALGGNPTADTLQRMADALGLKWLLQ